VATPAEIALAVWGNDLTIATARNKALAAWNVPNSTVPGGPATPFGVAMSYVQRNTADTYDGDSPAAQSATQALAALTAKVDAIIAALTDATSPEAAAIVAAVRLAIEEATPAIAAASAAATVAEIAS